MLSIPFETDEELDEAIYRDILREAESIAERRLCSSRRMSPRSTSRTGVGERHSAGVQYPSDRLRRPRERPRVA